MNWYVWWGIAFGILFVTVVDAVVLSRLKYKRKRILTPNRALILGTFVSAFVLFCPLYLDEFNDSLGIVEWGKTFFVSVQHAIRLFAFDGDYMNIVDSVAGQPPVVQMLYTGLGAFLYFFAPMLTFSLILSFFKNVSAYIRYRLSFWQPTHVFSELNEKSLALAKSIDETHDRLDRGVFYKFFYKPLLVFTDVTEGDDEDSLELIEQAKELGAILFSKDLESIQYRNRRASFRKVAFYLISEDEEEKIRHAESIIADYKTISACELFLFSDSIESKCFLDSYEDEEKKEIKLKVIRVNDIRSLVYHNLNENGIQLFESANVLEDGTREISAVIVGLGRYGMEALKALLWYCQLPGYRVRITAFDEQPNLASVFKAQCPEIKLNEDVDTQGDMRYTVNIREISFGTETFYSELEKIKNITYLFVCMGTDRQNITAAMGIRNWLAKFNRTPKIDTVVYDSSLKVRLDKVWKKQEMRIIGDLDSFYSQGTVINSDLIQGGLDVHKRWDGGDGVENRYYMNDYNFFSSVASALHRKLRASVVVYAEKQKEKKKEERKDPKEVFPFYYGEDMENVQKLLGGNILLLRSLLSELNDNERIMALASRMNSFADFLYIKLAYLHYEKLSADERKQVLDSLCKFMKKKNINIDVPMLADTSEYISGYREYIEDPDSLPKKRRVLRNMFDSIAAVKTASEKDWESKRRSLHSLEYSALTDSEKASVVEYIKLQMRRPENEPLDMDKYFESGKAFAYIEHIRWNAYMRAEGHRLASDTDKAFKLHFDLVPVELLTFADCVKDI